MSLNRDAATSCSNPGVTSVVVRLSREYKSDIYSFMLISASSFNEGVKIVPRYLNLLQYPKNSWSFKFPLNQWSHSIFVWLQITRAWPVAYLHTVTYPLNSHSLMHVLNVSLISYFVSCLSIACFNSLQNLKRHFSRDS